MIELFRKYKCEVEKLSNCIMMLDFENDFVKNILKIKTFRNSSKSFQNLQKIIKKLKVFKTYLPAHLYQAENEKARKQLQKALSKRRGGLIEESNANIKNEEDCDSDTSSNDSNDSNDSNYSYNSHTSSDDSANSDVSISSIELFDDNFIRKKRSSTIIACVTNFYKVIKLLDEKYSSFGPSVNVLSEVLNKYLCVVETAIIQNSGTIFRVDGSEIIGVWRSMKSCYNPEVSACDAASKCIKWDLVKDSALKNIVDAEKILKDVKLRIAVTSGEVICGNVVSARTRRFIQIDNMRENSMTLLNPIIRLCNKVNSDVLIDSNTNNSVKYHFKTIKTEELMIPHCDKKHQIYIIGNRKIKSENKEWMYVLDESFDK